MKRIKTPLTLFIILSLIGCATIMHGGKQDIYLRSNPSGAIVRVDRIATTTPGVITLDRKVAFHVLVFEKEGYKPVEVELRRTIDGWFFGNILLYYGGIVGIVIDFLTGSVYKITPSKVDVDFYEKKARLLKDKQDIIICVDMEYLIKNKSANLENLEKI